MGPLVICLVRVTSDRAATGWLTDEALLVVSGSGVGLPIAGADAAVAALTRVLPPSPGSTTTLIWMVGDCPGATSPRGQVTVPVAKVQLPPLFWAETKVRP